MVNAKTILIAIVVIAAGVYAAFYLFESEESKIKKQFKLMSEVIAKDAGENKLALAVKTAKLKSLLAEKCSVDYEARSIERNFSSREIAQIVARVLMQYKECSTNFVDIGIEISGEAEASAVFTVELNGKTLSGDHVEDIHEVESELRKIEGEWVFHDFKLVDVLEK